MNSTTTVVSLCVGKKKLDARPHTSDPVDAQESLVSNAFSDTFSSGLELTDRYKLWSIGQSLPNLHNASVMWLRDGKKSKFRRKLPAPN